MGDPMGGNASVLLQFSLHLDFSRIQPDAGGEAIFHRSQPVSGQAAGSFTASRTSLPTERIRQSAEASFSAVRNQASNALSAPFS
jgi:hypothetical protein